MAFVVADRVKETTTTTGTGTVTLAGAQVGYQSFAAIGNANVTYYTIAGQSSSEWEVGLGTYTSSGTTLARTTVLASSNAGSLVNFSAGTKDVWCDYPAGRAVLGNNGYTENDADITISSTINTGRNAVSAGPVTVASGISVTVPSGSVWTIV
jgi:acetyltransferase-like isoleucine patch superfamily enzyme